MAKKAKRNAPNVINQSYELADVNTLSPHPRNPNEGDIGAIVDSIETNGFYGAIVAQTSTRHIIAGEHRWRAAREAGITHVPVIFVDADDTASIRIMLADNRTAELARRAESELYDLLRDLATDTPARLSGTGYDMDFLDDLRLSIEASTASLTASDEPLSAQASSDDADEEPRALACLEKWKVEQGDVWRIPSNSSPSRAHLVACIDSSDGDALSDVLGGHVPELGLHDPPYGTRINFGSGIQGGGNKIKSCLARQNKYLPVANDDVDFDPTHLLSLTRLVVIWGFNYFADKLPPTSNIFVWDKRVDLPQQSFADCELAWINEPRAARVLRHRWHGMIRDSEHGVKRYHPTQKPIAVQRHLIEEYSSTGDTVLDCYGGSGSTLMAAEACGRLAICCELMPEYVAVHLERAEELGLKPELLKRASYPQTDKEKT